MHKILFLVFALCIHELCPIHQVHPKIERNKEKQIKKMTNHLNS